MARNHSLKTFICFLLSSFYDRSIISIFSFVSKSSSSSLSSVQFSHPTASLQTKMGAFKVKLLLILSLSNVSIVAVLSLVLVKSDLSFYLSFTVFFLNPYQVVKIAIPTERDVQPKIVREDTERRQSRKWISTSAKEGGEEDATTARWRKKIGGEEDLVEMTTASTSEMRKKTRRWLRKKTRRSSGSDKAEDR
ncbi:unnamed protein product [Brassica oleracea]|uniref:Transmembrane protein n=1 Tax=Brassica oleracea TaxID=3712 RepID=A0A3P6GAD0_BRAOL|nr:unnamed protein product [Brassica oleracea]